METIYIVSLYTKPSIQTMSNAFLMSKETHAEYLSLLRGSLPKTHKNFSKGNKNSDSAFIVKYLKNLLFFYDT